MGVPPLLRLFSVGAGLILCTRYFGNINYLADVFVRGGKRSWMCTGGLTTYEKGGIVYEGCPDQIQFFNELYGLMCGCEQVGSIIAGLLMAAVGSQITAILGITGQIIAVLLYALDSPQCQTMIFGGIISALSINSIGTPSFVLAQHFPKYKELCSSFTIACQCLAVGVLPVLWKTWNFFPNAGINQVLIAFLLLVIIPIGVLYILMIGQPDVNPLSQAELSMSTEGEDVNQLEEFSPLLGAPTERTAISSRPDDQVSNSTIQRRRRSTVLDKFRESSTTKEALDNIAIESSSVLDIIASPQFVVFACLNLCSLSTISYFFMQSTSILSEQAVDFVSNWMTIQAVYAIMWGAIYGAYGIHFTMACHYIGVSYPHYYLRFQYAVLYLLTLVRAPLSQFLAANVLHILAPFTYAFKFTFVMDAWPPESHDILFGVLGGISGLVTLVMKLISYFADVNTMVIAFPVISMANLVPLAWLWTLKRQRQKIE